MSPTNSPESRELPKLGLVLQHMLGTLQCDLLQPNACFASCLQTYSDLVVATAGNFEGWLRLLGAELGN